MDTPKIIWSHLCDRAIEHSHMATLNEITLIGILDELVADKFPFHYPRITLAFVIHIPNKSIGDPDFKPIDFSSFGGTTTSEDGTVGIDYIIRMTGQGYKTEPVLYLPTQLIKIEYCGITFSAPGLYQFSVLFDGNVIHTLPLLVSE